MISDRMSGHTSGNPTYFGPRRAFYALRCLPPIFYGRPEDERLDVALGPDSHRDGTLATNQVEFEA
jgi:hypothetical protein